MGPLTERLLEVSVEGGRHPRLSHSQLSLSSCVAGPCLKWPEEALDQLKRKQRVNSYFGPCPNPRHFQVDSPPPAEEVGVFRSGREKWGRGRRTPCQ